MKVLCSPNVFCAHCYASMLVRFDTNKNRYVVEHSSSPPMCPNKGKRGDLTRFMESGGEVTLEEIGE